jgi:arylsulfatase A-like enzyme
MVQTCWFRHFIPGAAGVLIATLSLISAGADGAARAKPNIIFILVDDLGVSDLSCYGSALYETPHLDALARDGVRFTQAYSACTVCSPTRAAFLTGRHPAALRLTDWIPGHARPFAKLTPPDWTRALPDGTRTIARHLRDHGYATASIGKWHLGENPPTSHGFDLNIAGTGRGQPPSFFAPYRIPTLQDGRAGESLTERLTAEAGNWIQQQRERPFFLFLAHFAVHTPIQANPEVVEKYRRKIEDAPGVPQGRAGYAAMVESVDESVGRLREKLDEHD